jgi:hypothetical protein
LQSKHDDQAKQGHEKVLVLVKALPHAGKRHGETVCCAGITAEGEWRRQYPVHFRRLQTGFARWDWIEYDWVKPKGDERRKESRRVQESTIKVCGKMAEKDRAKFLNRFLVPSTIDAAKRDMSLAILRPKQSHFFWKRKKDREIERERTAYQAASKQLSFLDKELAALSPCPYEFKFKYETQDDIAHEATCDDWETTAMFYNLERRYGAERALNEMNRIFNTTYPTKGMAFAMGTHSRFPDIWLLVGVLRLDQTDQLSLEI